MAACGEGRHHCGRDSVWQDHGEDCPEGAQALRECSLDTGVSSLGLGGQGAGGLSQSWTPAEDIGLESGGETHSPTQGQPHHL